MSATGGHPLRPVATILVHYRDKEIQATASGDGGYDAFMQALKSVEAQLGLRPVATILVHYRDKEIQATASGDGGYDAFMQALKSVEAQLGLRVPRLLDYEVRKTDALVETTIQWDGGLTTRGVDTDQLAAAIQATEHAINVVTLYSAPQKRRAKTPTR